MNGFHLTWVWMLATWVCLIGCQHDEPPALPDSQPSSVGKNLHFTLPDDEENRPVTQVQAGKMFVVAGEFHGTQPQGSIVAKVTRLRSNGRWLIEDSRSCFMEELRDGVEYYSVQIKAPDRPGTYRVEVSGVNGGVDHKPIEVK